MRLPVPKSSLEEDFVKPLYVRASVFIQKAYKPLENVWVSTNKPSTFNFLFCFFSTINLDNNNKSNIINNLTF